MGTNFYLKGHTDSDDPKFHIGKRSAAGPYCFDCKITLCKGGDAGIHTTKWNRYEKDWYNKCPFCGKKPIKEDFGSGAAGRELGFDKSPFSRKTGVASCSSFTWARKLCKVRKIEDEYGIEYTRDEFEKMLEECPVQYHHSIGQWFS